MVGLELYLVRSNCEQYVLSAFWNRFRARFLNTPCDNGFSGDLYTGYTDSVEDRHHKSAQVYDRGRCNLEGLP
jgi:hypothetical protein